MYMYMYNVTSPHLPLYTIMAVIYSNITGMYGNNIIDDINEKGIILCTWLFLTLLLVC